MSEETQTTEEAGPDDDKYKIVAKKYRERYGKDRHCGDDIAALLKDQCVGEDGKVDLKKVEAVAKANKLTEKFAEYTDKGLNNGMIRMNIGNLLRGLHNKGTNVKIGKNTVQGAEKEEAEAA